MKKLAPILVSISVLGLFGPPTPAAPLGTAFTYQGRLEQHGSPAPDGIYKIHFTLYDAPTLGTLLVDTPTNTVPVTNGLFSTDVDFGAAPFTGLERWMRLDVRPAGQAVQAEVLSPRTRLAPTPNAIYASSAGTVTNGAIQVSQLGTAGAPPSAGQALTFNGASLIWQAPAAVSGAWSVSGNNASAGQFLGTTGNQPLEVKVNNTRAARLEPTVGAPNVIFGRSNNSVSNGVLAGTIGGGEGHLVTGNHSTIGGGNANSCGSNAAFVGGGSLNHANGSSSTLAGGYDNTASGDVSFIGGGARNRASSMFSVVGGGELNQVSGNYGTIAGGDGNQTLADDTTVGGGFGNSAEGMNATIPGGLQNIARGANSFAAGSLASALHDNSFVWADYQTDPRFPLLATPYESTGPNQFCVRAKGGVQLNTDTSVYFGSQVRQMLNLWDVQYGIGVQAATLYFRTHGVFAWHRDGTHVDAVANAGPGGSTLMTLDDNGLVVNASTTTKVLTITGGADLAEPFPMKEEEIEKGSVVVIDEEHPGRLKLSTRAYDTQVAGIVSGANGIKPGIALKQEGTLDGGQNVALTGRVYVKADASFGSIKPGDLLTTSDTHGHAMKVTDHTKSQGAILGKAMSALQEGIGLVLVLVTLQ